MNSASDTTLAYAIFHLNLMYSSIEEESRPEVVERCYWPLLELIADPHVRLGIEAPALTLELIHEIDPAWTAEFARLLHAGECELIGSGYSQVIGPLVPAEVNEANLRLGNEVYRNLLGVTPEIAYINELACSAGILEHYGKAGFKGVVMEWENPYGTGRSWDPVWRFFPQKVAAADGSTLPVIWVHSNAFQKFQAYVHGELGRDEYLDCLRSLVEGDAGCLPIYGNDAEIFDFRPGRYKDEPLRRHGEWDRIRSLLKGLADDATFTPATPGEVLAILDHPLAGNPLKLESPERPVPTKKQMQYNITRWAVTGRHDSAVNSACRRLHARMLETGRTDDEAYRKLLYLWSSDFRTHITPARWEKYLKLLHETVDDFGADICQTPPTGPMTGVVNIRQEKRLLQLSTDRLKLDLLPWKGLAAARISFSGVSDHALAGTIKHGYFDDITHLADFFTGHAEWEPPGLHKVTDLSQVEPEITETAEGLRVSCAIPHTYGEMRKFWVVPPEEDRLILGYEFDWTKPPTGAIRLGHVTLLPNSFDQESLFFRTHNGGYTPERFAVGERTIDHGRHVSLLISAENGLGMTGGSVELGDASKLLRVSVIDGNLAPVAMVTHRRVAGARFFRLSFSVLESDDTRANGTANGVTGCERIVFSLEARKRSSRERATGKPGAQ